MFQQFQKTDFIDIAIVNVTLPQKRKEKEKT